MFQTMSIWNNMSKQFLMSRPNCLDHLLGLGASLPRRNWGAERLQNGEKRNLRNTYCFGLRTCGVAWNVTRTLLVFDWEGSSTTFRVAYCFERCWVPLGSDSLWFKISTRLNTPKSQRYHRSTLIFPDNFCQLRECKPRDLHGWNMEILLPNATHRIRTSSYHTNYKSLESHCHHLFLAEQRGAAPCIFYIVPSDHPVFPLTCQKQKRKHTPLFQKTDKQASCESCSINRYTRQTSYK